MCTHEKIDTNGRHKKRNRRCEKTRVRQGEQIRKEPRERERWILWGERERAKAWEHAGEKERDRNRKSEKKVGENLSYVYRLK